MSAAFLSSQAMVLPSVTDVVARALAEDLGDGDVTTAATVPEQARARAVITQKAPGVIFGLDAAQETFRALDPEVEFAAAGRRGRVARGRRGAAASRGGPGRCCRASARR